MEVKRTSFFAACIKCGTPSKSVLEKSGEYNNILMEVLQTVALTNEEWNETDITYISFDATKGFLPRVQTLEDFDAVIITGSGKNGLRFADVILELTKGCTGYSANDTYPWVLKLGSFIKGMCTAFKLFKDLSNNNLEAYQEKPEIRLFGVCFGHQIICKALFEVRILLEAADTSLFHCRLLTPTDF
jgi:hypothetical protein